MLTCVGPYTEATWEVDDDARTMLSVADTEGVAWRALVRAQCAIARAAFPRAATLEPHAEDALAAAEAWAFGAAPTRYDSYSAYRDSYRAASVAYESVSNVTYDFVTDGGAAPRLRHRIPDCAVREVDRRLAALVRAHVPWSALVAARDGRRA